MANETFRPLRKQKTMEFKIRYKDIFILTCFINSGLKVCYFISLCDPPSKKNNNNKITNVFSPPAALFVLHPVLLRFPLPPALSLCLFMKMYIQGFISLMLCQNWILCTGRRLKRSHVVGVCGVFKSGLQ